MKIRLKMPEFVFIGIYLMNRFNLLNKSLVLLYNFNKNRMNPESLNDVKSLVGKIDTKTMGQNSTRQKPKQESINKK